MKPAPPGKAAVLAVTGLTGKAAVLAMTGFSSDAVCPGGGGCERFPLGGAPSAQLAPGC